MATTCIASMNASWATFQLHRSTLATWTWTKRSSSGQRAKWSPSSPTWSASDGAVESGLMKTNPPHVPTCTSRRLQSAGLSTCGKSHAQGMLSKEPSIFQPKPWNGQRNSDAWQPPSVRSSRPRWRHTLWNAWIVLGPLRTTRYERPATS